MGDINDAFAKTYVRDLASISKYIYRRQPLNSSFYTIHWGQKECALTCRQDKNHPCDGWVYDASGNICYLTQQNADTGNGGSSNQMYTLVGTHQFWYTITGLIGQKVEYLFFMKA